MKILVLALALAISGCSASAAVGGSPVDLSVERAINGQPDKISVLHELRDAGVVKTAGDVTKVTMILDMSCGFVNLPGATSFSPERMQENLAQNWQLDVTTEQAGQFQTVQREFCA